MSSEVKEENEGDSTSNGLGGLFRSEEMEYVSLVIPEDDCHRCLAMLGRLDALQFVDVSSHLALSIYLNLLTNVLQILVVLPIFLFLFQCVNF